MSENRTHGYDLVYEFNDQLVNDLLPREPFPPFSGSHETRIGNLDIAFDYEVFFPDDPTIDRVAFDTSIDNGISLSSAFSMEISNEYIPDVIALAGEITVLQPISVYTDGLGRRCLGIDFSTLPADRVNVEITTMGSLGIPEETAEQYLERALHMYLRNLDPLSIMCIALTPDDNPLTINDIDVRIVGDDCAAILITTTDETVGDADAFSECHIPSSANSAFIISSRTLIMHIICPALLEALDSDEEVPDVFTYEDGHADLTEPVSLSHLVDHALVDSIRLRSARIFVGENSISLRSTIEIAGFGYRASADLMANVSFELHGGALVIDYSYDVADVDLDVYPWVWIAVACGAAVVPVVGGIVAIVLPILPFIIEPIAEQIVDHFFGGSGAETLSVPPMLPMLVGSVILDDLQFSGQSVAPYRPPIPGPLVDLVEEVETGEIGSANTFTHAMGSAWIMMSKWSISHEARYRAETLRMTYPVTFEWEITLEGWLVPTRLQPGNGIIETPDGPIEYLVDDRVCSLTIGEGQSLDAVIVVRATSATGVSCEDSRSVSIEGTVSSTSSFLPDSSDVAFVEKGPALKDETVELVTTVSYSYADAVHAKSEESTSEQPTRSALLSEFRQGLINGMGIDIPEEEFG